MSDNNKGPEIHNIGNYTFAQTGNSTKENNMGMREMQARAYEKRNSQYLLIQAPPACGKSRALMFLALDKVLHQGIKKVIIAVPQIAIGSSFKNTNLTEHDFFADWAVDPEYNLCAPGGEPMKVQKALKFLIDPSAKYLLCSHATLTYFYEKVADKHVFDNCLIAVDEFHHVSENAENKLGGVIHSLMTESSAHLIAMTGSYFRGDSVPVLSPEDEKHFERVTYTYYEQLNGYKYLKSLGINYAFYYGSWVEAVYKVLDTSKKTIIHIPSVNSRESTGDKLNEVGRLFDLIGTVLGRDEETGIYNIRDNRGRILHVADLVTDTDNMQGVTLSALRDEKNLEKLNIIIALGMAKEGFDWPQCEYALTIGYRASLTEVVQIIGRATRDYPGKTHVQFTNLLAMPDALLNDVTDAVNSLLKAITLSLLMEQVLAPNVHFRKRSDTQTPPPVGGSSGGRKPSVEDGNNDITITIDDENVSQNAVDIINTETPDIINKLINSSDTVINALANGGEGVCKELAEEDVADIIREEHPDLDDDDIEAIAKAVVTTLLLKVISHDPKDEEESADQNTDGGTVDPIPHGPRKPFVEVDQDNSQFVKIGDKFINVDDLDFNLIEAINPFRNAYEFISKSIEPEILKEIQAKAAATREKMTEQKARELWPYINAFVQENGREPSITSNNDFERRLAVALEFIREKKRKQNAKDRAEAAK